MVKKAVKNPRFHVKIHRRQGHVLVAAADEDILGKTFEGNGLRITVTESFYSGEVLDKAGLVARLRIATMANLVGKDCVAAAVEGGFVKKTCILKIGGTHHAQMLCYMEQ